MVQKLRENSRSPGDSRIRYQEGRRFVGGFSEVQAAPEGVRIPWKDQGVYVITGGAGGLGLIFAEAITQKAKDATLILMGRSPLSEDKQARLEKLQALGGRIEYRQVDVLDQGAVAEFVQMIRTDHGKLDGIIHAAGVIRDNFIIKKTREELHEVLAPKVTGLVNLDQASKDLSLDFFMFFSSGAGALGNIGQCDYSAANAFMDGYADYRNSLVASKQRKGRTLSINWPLWKEGGMGVDEATEMMMQSVGMIAMQTETGIQALYQSFTSGRAQVMVMEGSVMQIRRSIPPGLYFRESRQLDNSPISDGTVQFNEAFYRDIIEKILNGQLSEDQFKSMIANG